MVVGRRRGKEWRRVGFGLYRQQDAVCAHDPAKPSTGAASGMVALTQERLGDLQAWQAVLPATGCFTHLTAAEVYGLWLPPVPAGLPVLACTPKEEDRVRREGLRVSRLTTDLSPRQVQGLRLAPVAETVLACARDLGLLDLLVMMDSAVRLGLCSADELAEAAGLRRRGAPALREALPLVDPRAESPWETLLRAFHVLCEVPVEPQFEVYDERGVFVARGDLRILGTRTLHEYDGAGHRDRRTHVNDLARDRRLVNAGWVRRGYTSADLLSRAHLILREADAELGRRHDPRRLRPWLQALSRSLFTSTGRRQLLARWGLDSPASGQR